jgi:hypothetical protein
MISLTPVIQLLKTKPEGFASIWFRKVEGAAEFAKLAERNDIPLPAAWIVRAADRTRHAGERAEDVTLAFDVVIAIENARTHGDGDTDDQLLAYRLAVKDCLLGWTLPDSTRPIKFQGGQVLEYSAGDIYWRDRYTFAALITNYLPDPVPVFTGIDNTEATANDHYL